MKSTRKPSRPALAMLSWPLAALAAAPIAHAATVGDPKNAAALPQQIRAAYEAGEKTITIRPGKYLLPGGDQSASLTFEGMKNVRIEAGGVELSLADKRDGLGFNRCENVTFRGATVHYERPRFSQAKIVGFGTDAAKGPFYDVLPDAGFRFPGDWKSSYIFDAKARKIKFRTWDMSAASVEILDKQWRETGRLQFDGLPPAVRVFWPKDDVMPPKYNVALGDYLVCRGDGSSLLHVDASKNCTFENLRFYWGGVFGIFETGRSEANTFRNIWIARGPSPGIGNPPLISQSADGLHSAGSRVGPTIENCTFEAMCDDGIAIHGYFVDILAVDGAKLTTKALWGQAGFQIGDTARISSDKGFLEEAKIAAIEKLNDGNFGLILDRALDVKAGYKVGNPSASGAGFKLIGNTIRNNRARGILVKGDDGLIANNTIDGSTMSGISIGPEYYWNEADYPRRVTIRGNRILNTNYATNNFGRNGGILIHGDGTRGNRDITIENNQFDGVLGPNLIIEWAQGVQIRRNTFANTHAKSVGDDEAARALVWLRNSEDVEFAGNTIVNAGAQMKDVVLQGEGVANVRGVADGFVRGVGKTAPQVLAGERAAFEYSNPLPFRYMNSAGKMDEREVRDPCIIREGDTYYMVFTMWPFANREDGRMGLPDNGSSPGIQLYSSRDLKNWKPENWLVKSSALPENSPYKHRFWAPEIHKFGGKFYLIFTADNWLKAEHNPAGSWGAAGYAFVGVADKITGPYEHITYIPQGACDTTLAQDSAGQIFAVMPKHDIFARPIDLSRLHEGKVSWLGEEKKILECNGGTDLKDDPKYLEGPWVERVGGKFVLFYAELFRDDKAPEKAEYWTGAAYADSILGPWTKDRRGKVFEGGHVAIFDGPGARKWISYRIEQQKNRGLLAIDPFSLDAAGRVQVRPR